MSEITKWFPTEVCKGDVMPWFGCVIQGSKWLILPGITGRGRDMKQEYPELLEQEHFDSGDQARLVVCPHSVEEQTVLILEKIEKLLADNGTSFGNVFNCDYYITDRANWPDCWRTFKSWMDGRAPEYFEFPRPGVLSIVHGLDHPDMLVEIRMWATVPE
jgi:enamine deaminase RidA (YjgF/YER057c/UK114 family)